MNASTLVKDLAIVAILIVAGTLIYLALPGSPATSQNTANLEGTSSNEPTTVTPTPSPSAQLKIEVKTEGSGAVAENGKMISVNYRGTLTDGTEFDSSYKRNMPFSFTLGAGEVIPGWDIGILGMKVGEKRVLTVPSDLAYGPSGFPPVIPPNATLTFEVELLDVK